VDVDARHRIGARKASGAIKAISFDMKASVPADVLLQELQGESVLLNLESGVYFGLNEVGTRMWAVLTTTGSLQAAYDALLPEYEIEAEQLERDFRGLVEKLVENGLVKIREH
jgi:Coenzyme PQQ synthesis protein D (PqqD)